MIPILFPNVPNVPGVPQLPRSPDFPADPEPALASGAPQDPLFDSTQVTPTWGIYDADGNLAVHPDSFLAFGSRAAWRVSNAPQQPNAFTSYDKVTVPLEVRVRLAKGGTAFDRQTFLSEVAAVAASIDLYSIVTPEATYTNMTVDLSENERRGPESAFYLGYVDLNFIQIIQATAQYSSSSVSTQDAQVASAQPSTGQGLVQPQTPAPAVVSGAAAAATAP